MRLFIVLALLTTLAAPAAAVPGGIELSMNGCPGNPGALGGTATETPGCNSEGICGDPNFSDFTGPSVIDCTSGAPIVILVTWAPNENITDLANLDARFTVQFPANGSGENLDQSTFWNFDPAGCDRSALGSSHLRPAEGCNAPDYLDVWNVPGGGSAIGAEKVSPTLLRIASTSYRPTPISVSAGQRLFGLQIVIAVSNSAERGGSCSSCCTTGGVGIGGVGNPGSFGASSPTKIDTPMGNSGFSSAIGLFNSPAACAAVPTINRTWGQLKTLYR